MSLFKKPLKSFKKVVKKEDSIKNVKRYKVFSINKFLKLDDFNSIRKIGYQQLDQDLVVGSVDVLFVFKNYSSLKDFRRYGKLKGSKVYNVDFIFNPFKNLKLKLACFDSRYLELIKDYVDLEKSHPGIVVWRFVDESIPIKVNLLLYSQVIINEIEIYIYLAGEFKTAKTIKKIDKAL